jgi:hypothetical protein
MPDVSDALSHSSANIDEPLPIVRGRTPTPVSTGRARAFATIAIAAVALVQIWIVSAGRMIDWPASTNYYSLLADAFLHGQTSLRDGPSPQLLALPDPYDPSQNQNFRLHDMSLYRGKYFLYWGPVPAILECPLVLLFQRPIGDQYLVFCFVFGIMLISAEILLDLRKRLFPDAAPWTVAMGILVAGLATPMPILLERPAVYEAAIAAGQFFLLSGIYCLIRAFAAGQPRRRFLLLAGICCALAVGSRASLAVATAGLTLSVGWRLLRPSSLRSQMRSRSHLAAFAAIALPVFLGSFLLGCYNYVRFGNWLEFGVRYQLASFDRRPIEHGVISLANIPPAAYAYSFKPFVIVGDVPFIKAVSVATSRPEFIKLPRAYESSEPVAGLLWCVPFLVFAAVPLGTLFRRLLPLAHGNDQTPGDVPRQRELAWIVLWSVLASILGLLPALFMIFGCSMRYLADCTPMLVIVATLGMWHATSGQPKSRRVTILACLLSLYSIAIGILLASAVIAGQSPLNPADSIAAGTHH